MKFERILVPVDFTPGTRDAVRHARAIAQQFGSAVHLLYALPAPDTPHWNAWFNGAKATSAPERVHAVHRLAAVIVGERLDPRRTTGVLRIGQADEVIRRYANEIEADLIVMGTHGDRESAAPIGQVAASVLNQARCAVLTVPRTTADVLEIADNLERLAG
jgi:nucleotide-binding universal stress UspA family protein